MKVKVLFILTLTLLSCIGVSNAKVNEYALTFQKQNRWVAQEDISPVRELIILLKQNPLLSIKSVCSKKDLFCKERVDIMNIILKAQGVSQKITKVEKSDSLDKNKMLIKITQLDSNKYDIVFINYQNQNTKPIAKSQKDIKTLLAKSELKYLSQFRFYCNKKDSLCENRFNFINKEIAKTLTFKYNISLAINPNLGKTKTGLAAYRHDYNFIPQEITEKRSSAKVKPVTKPVKYTNDTYTIVFETNSSVLSIKEKKKIEKIVKENPAHKFYFACNRAEPELCESRIREIKFHALTATDNLIELYQLEKSAPANYVIIKKDK